jgi:cardiolipin synthase A/B
MTTIGTEFTMNNTGNHPFSIKIIQKVYGTHFTDSNKVDLLWKDKEIFHAIFDSIKSAKEFICLQFYIFRDDETGKELAEILKQKASEGVTVYIIYDHFGSLFTSNKFWKDLMQAGVQIRASRPFKWTAPFHYVHRDHRKLIIIDGTKAFIGGLNIANEYRGYHKIKKSKGWRDTGILLEGPSVKTLLDTFKASWLIWKGGPIQFNPSPDPVPDGLPVLPIFASSAKGRRRMRRLLYYSITHAEKSIYLTTAYFTPSLRMLFILKDAVKRGVDVKLLLQGKSDVSSVHYAGRAFFSILLKAGVEIYNYKGEVLHAKTYMFDGVWSIIGSSNLDFQSLRRNDEGNVGIIDKGFGSLVTGMFYEDLKHSEKIIPQSWFNRPVFEKISEFFYALFRRRL